MPQWFGCATCNEGSDIGSQLSLIRFKLSGDAVLVLETILALLPPTRCTTTLW